MARVEAVLGGEPPIGAAGAVDAQQHGVVVEWMRRPELVILGHQNWQVVGERRHRLVALVADEHEDDPLVLFDGERP